MESLSTAGRARISSSTRRAALLLVLLGAALAQPQRTGPAHSPVRLESPVQDKNFYLLSMIERTPAVRDAVKSDPVLSRIAVSRLTTLDTAAKSCAVNLACYTDAFRWSDEQSAEAAHALSGLYRSSAAMRAFADAPLRASGMYVRYHALSGEELLDHAFADCMRGLNHMIDVYGLGKAPRYPAIDAATYDVKSVAWARVVQNLTAVLGDGRASLELFFEPSLRFALELMLLNQRDEAGRLEPLEAGENAEAFGRIPMVDWDRYAYSVIVVPGSGNDRPGVRLSPGGRLRDELAARRYREGKAPFVLVSGGFVHPERTEFAEALEMKRDLMSRFGIPANAIIVDPHARHTTTNMRNAARLMYRYGMPFGKKALVTTDLGQSASIESPAFEKRCLTELGYAPQKILGRISPFDLEFLPTLDSLHGDPQDPLDP